MSERGMTREEVETKPLSEVALLLNFCIAQAISHPLLPTSAADVLQLAGVLIGRLAREVETLKGARE